MFFGGVIKTDTAELKLIVDGGYFEGLKTGYWKNYDFTGALISEGKFADGQETGEWRYYHRKWDNGEGGLKPYSEKLFLIENYKFGKLEGKSTRFSYLEKEKFPCSEIDENENPLDTCSRLVYIKVFETEYYKNGKLNGPAEYRDSLNEIIAKGMFKDDLKVGEWLHRYSISDGYFFVYQKGNYFEGEREGQWIEYYTEGEIAGTFNYKNGDLHGEYTVWNNQNKPIEIKQFKYGKLTELVVYDSLGMKPKIKYEIYDEKDDTFKCRKTDYSDDGYSSQEYWVKKVLEIDHPRFELTFLMAIDESFNEGTYGYKDGVFNLFNSNNQPLIAGKYYKEDKIGLWTFYFYEKNVKIEANFLNGQLINEKYLTIKGELFSGKFVFDDIENGITEERKIKDGLRNGKTVYIDNLTKKTIKKESYKNGELN